MAFELPLAGLGSRFGALVLDGLCVLAAGLAGSGVVLLVAQLPGVTLVVSPALFGSLLVLWFGLLLWGWFFFFEAFRDGRTPGKRAFGLRVVRSDGGPLGVREAAVRNLVRILDLQPGFACLVGGFTMLLDRHGRRLGDLAAGTVVVRLGAIDLPEVADTDASTAHGPPRLGDEAFEALSGFVRRAPELDRRVAEKLAKRFAVPLAELDPGGARAARNARTFAESFHAAEVLRRAAARRGLDAGAPAAVRQLAEKRERWLELTAELERLGTRRPAEDDVARAASHLRELSSDLARARTYGAAPATVMALERSVALAHARLYRARPSDPRRLAAFFARGFPERVAGARRSVLLSAVALFGPAIAAYLFLRANPQWELALAGEEMVRRAQAALDNPAYDYRDTWESAWMGSDALSAYLIANNVQVALLAFAGGMTLGITTMITLVFNGLHLGTAFAVFANRGVLENLVSFIAPHGGIELSAIVLAGGAAFHMASGFWRPGRRGRGVALRDRAREAVGIVGGVVAMLLLAGVIEGFVSPARISASLKWAAGGLALVALAVYFGGRPRSVTGHRGA